MKGRWEGEGGRGVVRARDDGQLTDAFVARPLPLGLVDLRLYLRTAFAHDGPLQDLGMAMTHAAALADTLHVNVFTYEYVVRAGQGHRYLFLSGVPSDRLDGVQLCGCVRFSAVLFFLFAVRSSRTC